MINAYGFFEAKRSETEKIRMRRAVKRHVALSILPIHNRWPAPPFPELTDDMKAMYQASGDKLAVRECNERIKRYKDKYAEISNITGIAQDKKRMTLTGANEIKGTLTSTITKTPKFTAMKPQKSFKNVDNSAKSGIIKDHMMSKNKEKPCIYAVFSIFTGFLIWSE